MLFEKAGLNRITYPKTIYLSWIGAKDLDVFKSISFDDLIRSYQDMEVKDCNSDFVRSKVDKKLVTKADIGHKHIFDDIAGVLPERKIDSALIIGYNESREKNSRQVSHNIVVGEKNNFSSFGGIVAGYKNTISGKYSIAGGGHNNVANGEYSTITGGAKNSAKGKYTSISGQTGRTKVNAGENKHFRKK